VPAAKRTVGVGLADLLRSTAMPNASKPATAPPVVAASGELPPGFFDDNGAGGDAGDAPAPAPANGLSSLLSMLPPPSRSRGGAAVGARAPDAHLLPAAQAPPPKRLRADEPAAGAGARAAGPSAASGAGGAHAPVLPGIALPGMGGEDESEDEADDEDGTGAGAAPGGVWTVAQPRRTTDSRVPSSDARADAQGPSTTRSTAQLPSPEDDGDGFGDVTAPYPGGDDDVTAPYPGGDDDVTAPYPPYPSGNASYPPHAPRAQPQQHQARRQQQQQHGGYEEHGAVPAELLSRAERRALADSARGGDGGATIGMAAINQDEMRRTFRPTAEVVIPRPAADVHVEGRVYNRQSGAAEVTSKPTGQQKRRNQINQLAHQYQQNAPELEQRGSKGLKSKGQTYGRYGW
jgi:hypothetical protein